MVIRWFCNLLLKWVLIRGCVVLQYQSCFDRLDCFFPWRACNDLRHLRVMSDFSFSINQISSVSKLFVTKLCIKIKVDQSHIEWSWSPRTQARESLLLHNSVLCQESLSYASPAHCALVQFGWNLRWPAFSIYTIDDDWIFKAKKDI